jgi:3-phosphoshikimate 1-carboxyvinyltransferase
VTKPLEIRPRGPLDATLLVPGSKSLTNRALPLAALASGSSQLSGALQSDDTDAMRECLERLGIRIETSPDVWRVEGGDGRLDATQAPLDARASGTTARFLTALCTLSPGECLIDGAPRMRERPIDDLVRALCELGADVETQGVNGCPPVRVAGGGLPGGAAVLDASRSSQFVTAVLLVAPYADQDVRLSLKDGVLVSRPYVDLTLQVMGEFGAEAGWQDEATLHVTAGRTYRGRDYTIEPDASSAAYPLCAAAIAGGRVRISNVRSDSLQADWGLLEILERMGCSVSRGPDWVELTAPEAGLHGVDVDMNAMPDATVALAVLALFARGPTQIRNVAQVRMHETDRLAALETELRKLGGRATASPDGLLIQPGPLRGAEIEPYDDHRMAMAFALAGLRVPGVQIRDPGCVAKTWPDYFEVLERL